MSKGGGEEQKKKPPLPKQTNTTNKSKNNDTDTSTPMFHPAHSLALPTCPCPSPPSCCRARSFVSMQTHIVITLSLGICVERRGVKGRKVWQRKRRSSAVQGKLSAVGEWITCVVHCKLVVGHSCRRLITLLAAAIAASGSVLLGGDTWWLWRIEHRRARVRLLLLLLLLLLPGTKVLDVLCAAACLCTALTAATCDRR